MDWFKHPTNFRNSEISDLIQEEFGYKGLVVYFRILETIAQRKKNGGDASVKLTVRHWLSELKLQANEGRYLRNFVERLASAHIFYVSLTHVSTLKKDEQLNLGLCQPSVIIKK